MVLESVIMRSVVNEGVQYATYGGGATVGAVALLWLWKHLRLGLLPLFTRLVRPRLLDQPVRARIVEVVEAAPGIHHSAIAQRLALAEGQALYHLGVLVREEILSRVDTPGHRHYFPRGRFAPNVMRAMATLRSGPSRRMYDVIRTRPGMDVATCARELGVSGPRVSRLSRRLESVGLLRREAQGRRVILFPLAPVGMQVAPTFRSYVAPPPLVVKASGPS